MSRYRNEVEATERDQYERRDSERRESERRIFPERRESERQEFRTTRGSPEQEEYNRRQDFASNRREYQGVARKELPSHFQTFR